MERCSATDVFDPMVEYIIQSLPLGAPHKVDFIRKLMDVLEDYDWDCQSDSKFWQHEYVQIAFRELHPERFQDESEAR